MNMKHVFFLVIFIILLISCQTKPEPVPEWVSHSPEASEEEVFFTASGSDSSGNSDEARAFAEAALIQKIISSIGIKPTSDSDLQALKALEELNNKLVRNISGSASDGACIKIIDQYVNQNTVYLLASCRIALFDEEKRNLLELFSDQRASILNTGNEGDRLYNRASYFKASLKFLEAAGDAYNSGLTTKRNIQNEMVDKALGCLDKMTVEIITGSHSVTMGHSFPEVLQGKTIPGNIPLQISVYRDNDSEPELLQTYTTISGRNGSFGFLPSYTEFTGDYTVFISPDYSSAPDLFKSDMAVFHTVYHYFVENPAKSITLGLLIQDVGNRGKPVYDKAVSGMQYIMKERGYKTVLLTSSKTEQALALRIILNGKARFSGFYIKDKIITVKVKGSVFVTDREKAGSEILESGNISVSADGDSLESASSEAFYQFGLLAAEKILEAYASY